MIALLAIAGILIVGGFIYYETHKPASTPVWAVHDQGHPTFTTSTQSINNRSTTSAFGGPTSTINISPKSSSSAAPNTDKAVAVSYQQSASTGYDMSGLPDCSGYTFLSVAPTSLSGYSLIQPMGNVSSYHGNAGDVLPSNHLYFYLDTNAQGATLPTTVMAPADIKILKINAKDYGPNGKDNQIYFASCREVVLMYDHIDTLNSSITSAINDASHKTCNSDYMIGNTAYQQCSYSLDNVTLKAGDELGIAGGPGVTTMAFDFGVYDYRVPPAAFIDPGKMSNLYAVCPLDYYPAGTVKTDLFNKIENTQKNSEGLPDCGTYMQDKIGTIQGNWYLPNTSSQGPIPDDHLLAIIHKNINPSLGIIDWGGTIAPSDRLEFTIQSSGLVDREPSQVTADGQVYCYQNPSYNSKSIVLQLVDSNTLKIEYQSNLCAATSSFNDPSTYVR